MLARQSSRLVRCGMGMSMHVGVLACRHFRGLVLVKQGWMVVFLGTSKV